MGRSEKCLGVLGIVIAAAAATPAWAGWTSYDASLGSLPQAQGFLIYDSGDSPAPTVSAGSLHQGPTAGVCSALGYQHWYRNNAGIDFGASFVLDATVQIISSSDIHALDCGDDGWKAGYDLTVTDAAAHMFFVGITSDGVFLSNNNISDPATFPRQPVNTRDALHRYRLVVTANLATLYYDETPLTSLATGTYLNSGGENQVVFGDGTHRGSNESLTSLVRYTTDNLAAVDGALPPSSGLSMVLASHGASDEIRYSLPVPARTRLRVFDVTGRLVVTLADGAASAGAHQVVWGHVGAAGRGVSAGVYLVDLESGGRRVHGKILVLK
jgi:hypothetical protein